MDNLEVLAVVLCVSLSGGVSIVFIFGEDQLAFNWQCPFCGTHTTITETHTSSLVELNDNSKHKTVALMASSTACPNPECRELALTVYWGKPRRGAYKEVIGVDTSQSFLTKQLLPEAAMIVLPDGVPPEIAITYRETVLVSPISGRAAAAMARRCLQGIVRDFFAIPENKRGNLGAELSFVKDRIDPDLWDAIQALRGIGDIGAHMDKNVDQIIDVSPDEAQLLIELIETLFKDWYGVRAKRERNRAGLMSMLQDKREQQKAAKLEKWRPLLYSWKDPTTAQVSAFLSFVAAGLWHSHLVLRHPLAVSETAANPAFMLPDNRGQSCPTVPFGAGSRTASTRPCRSNPRRSQVCPQRHP